MTQADSGIAPGGKTLGVPRALAWVVYLQLAATIALVLIWRCSPATCSLLFDEQGMIPVAAYLFVGAGPPVIAALAPITILAGSIWKRPGWKVGLLLLSLSLLMSYTKVGIWVEMWS